MKTEFTKFELKNEVSKFYKGFLTDSKCIKLFELEFGFKPTIINNKDDIFVNTAILPKNDPILTKESFVFMKELQKSGTTNMFDSVSYIQQQLLINRDDARKILRFYLKNYTKLYSPEDLI